MEVMLWAHQSGYSSVWMKEVRMRLTGDGYGNRYCSIDKSIYLKAAKYGQLGALQWLTEHGCHGRSLLHGAVAAAEGGHLSVIQWLREQGCALDRRIASSAARG